MKEELVARLDLTPIELAFVGLAVLLALDELDPSHRSGAHDALVAYGERAVIGLRNVDDRLSAMGSAQIAQIEKRIDDQRSRL